MSLMISSISLITVMIITLCPCTIRLCVISTNHPNHISKNHSNHVNYVNHVNHFRKNHFSNSE